MENAQRWAKSRAHRFHHLVINGNIVDVAISMTSTEAYDAAAVSIANHRAHGDCGVAFCTQLGTFQLNIAMNTFTTRYQIATHCDFNTFTTLSFFPIWLVRWVHVGK